MLESNSDIAKLSQSPSSSWAELVLFSAGPTIHPPGKVFFWASANLQREAIKKKMDIVQTGGVSAVSRGGGWGGKC